MLAGGSSQPQGQEEAEASRAPPAPSGIPPPGGAALSPGGAAPSQPARWGSPLAARRAPRLQLGGPLAGAPHSLARAAPGGEGKGQASFPALGGWGWDPVCHFPENVGKPLSQLALSRVTGCVVLARGRLGAVGTRPGLRASGRGPVGDWGSCPCLFSPSSCLPRGFPRTGLLGELCPRPGFAPSSLSCAPPHNAVRALGDLVTSGLPAQNEAPSPTLASRVPRPCTPRASGPARGWAGSRQTRCPGTPDSVVRFKRSSKVGRLAPETTVPKA